MGPAVREVHHDEVAPAVRLPAPGDELVGGAVVRPTGALAQAPGALAQPGAGDGSQEPVVERSKLGVGGLLGAAGHEHRDVGA